MDRVFNDDIGVKIDNYLSDLYAYEDDALRSAIEETKAHGLPEIQVSAVQGKALQVLAMMARARSILEIGALGGYSGIWMARALPDDGYMISCELEAKHADVARAAYERAGVGDKVTLRVGAALDTLPELAKEGHSFDLVFIDADKENYPAYLEWALKLTHRGSVIIGDNTIRNGTIADSKATGSSALALRDFNQIMANHPRLVSVAFPIIKEGIDGMTVGVVR